MMNLKQSDFVAMSCIAAGVVFPFALMGAYVTLGTRQAEAEWTPFADASIQCQVEVAEVEVIEAVPTQVVIVLRRDHEPITVIGPKVRITELSSEVERFRVTVEELQLRATQERLRAISEAVQARRNSIHQAVIEVEVDAKADVARARLLAEELRVIKEQLQSEREADAKGIEALSDDRYQVAMEQLVATLEADFAQVSADDQQKKRKRKRKHRRPC